MHALNPPQAANIAKDNLTSSSLEVLSGLFIPSGGAHHVRRIVPQQNPKKNDATTPTEVVHLSVASFPCAGIGN